MSERLSKDFSANEFRCNCCGRVMVDEKLVQGLQKLRDRVFLPITVTSGYRCKQKNDSLPGAATNSRHLTGQAADIACAMPLLRFYFECLAIPEFQGIGLYIDGRFVHVDTREKRARWGRVAGKYVPILRALEALKASKKDADTNPDIPIKSS